MYVYRLGYVLFASDLREGNSLGNETHPILDHFASLIDFKSAVWWVFFFFFLFFYLKEVERLVQ